MNTRPDVSWGIARTLPVLFQTDPRRWERNRANVKDGDIVLLFGESSIWYPIVVLGTICAGSIFTGSNPKYTESVLIHQLDVSGAKCIFTDSQRLQAAPQAAKAVGIPRSSVFLIEDGETPGERTSEVWGSLLNHGTQKWERISDIEVLSQRPAVLNFSGGTAGRPKACIITYRNDDQVSDASWDYV